MAFRPLTFDELVIRARAFEADINRMTEGIQTSHPSLDLGPDFKRFTGQQIEEFPVTVREDEAINTRRCPDCECPMYTSYDRTLEQAVPACRDILNAVRLASVLHRNSDPQTMCYSCNLKWDDRGFLIGARHLALPIEDFEMELEGQLVTRPGLKSQIESGFMEVWEEGDEWEVVFGDRKARFIARRGL
jgi:hypothetical protein